MSQAIFKISAGFLVVALALVASSLYISERYIQSQQQLAAAGDIEGAMEAANSAARFDPFATEPLQTQAAILQSQGRNPEAERAWQQAIQREPNDFLLYLSLGDLQMAMGKFEAAEENFREVRRLNPMASAATRSIAQSLVRRGNLEEAGAEYEKLLESEEIDTLGLYDLGRILVRTGEPGRGYEIINQSRRRAENELETLEEPIRSQQEDLIESMKLAAADALVASRNYNAAYEQISESDSEQAPALLELISTDPEGYRQSVVNSEIY
ncbi:MAG: tetratricopeptide repeat protein [Rubrobacter sp.]|nr:tetratricopeptide repeat protein [Rubrobacter sp.]